MNQYNILFYLDNGTDPNTGGVERVDNTLAGAFIKRGSNVYSISAWIDGETNYLGQYIIPTPLSYSEENVAYLSYLIKQLDIQIVIVSNLARYTNQLNLRSLKDRVKIIAHHHNSPVKGNSFLYRLDHWRISKTLWFQNIVFQIQRRRIRAYYKGMSETADKIVLLSNEYISEMQSIYNFSETKFAIIHNPSVMKGMNDTSPKKNIVLYVGRIEEQQKRISSLVSIWRKTSKLLPNWELEIVGDGPDMSKLKKSVDKLKLKNVHVNGFMPPESFYTQAKIILLTSTYEGLPMVLIEAMRFGCVPIAFNSFSALSDIVDDGVNGFHIKPFKEKKFVRQLVHLASNEQMLNRMSIKAYNKGQEFGLDNIVDRWYTLFNSIME